MTHEIFSNFSSFSRSLVTRIWFSLDFKKVGKLWSFFIQLKKIFAASERKYFRMRLEKFLYCFELELGGIIIGFYHLVMYSILMISSVVAFVLTLIYGELKIEYLSTTSKLLSFRWRNKSDLAGGWIDCCSSGRFISGLHLVAVDHGCRIRKIYSFLTEFIS